MGKFAKILKIAKLGMYPLIAVFGLMSYFKTGSREDMILVWIAIVGMEVIVQAQKETEINIILQDKDDEKRQRRELDGEIAYLEAQVMERDVEIDGMKKQIASDDKLRQSLSDCNGEYITLHENYTKLRDELYAMKMAAEGRMKRTKVEKSPASTLKIGSKTEQGQRMVDELVEVGIIQPENVLAVYDLTEPVEPEPVPEPEPMQAVIEETEPQPTPDFNDTAVKETKTEEVTTVVKTKKATKKAPSATAFTQEQTTRYTQMILDKEPRKVILTAMMGEVGINEGAANNRYYALKEKMQKQKITDSIQAYNNNAVTVIKMEPNAKPLPRSIQAELDAMPVYDNIKAFKNAVCENELLKGYSIAELKEPYRSHRPDQVKW